MLIYYTKSDSSNGNYILAGTAESCPKGERQASAIQPTFPVGTIVQILAKNGRVQRFKVVSVHTVPGKVTEYVPSDTT